MADQRLIQYIKEQLTQKKDVTNIRRELIQAGYTLNLIDKTIGEIVQEQQTNNPIKTYINQFLQKGYTLPDIRIYLLRYYPQKSIDPIINDFIKKEKNKRLMKIIFFIAFITSILFITALAIYYALPAPQTEKINFKYYLQLNTIQQGGTLPIILQNIPNKRDKEIEIDNKIIDANTNQELKSWNQKYNKEEIIKTEQSYAIPIDFDVGNYRLIIKITYGNIIEKDEHNFRVITKTTEKSCFDGIKNQNEQGPDCGGICGKKCESCFDKIKNQNEEEIDCGGICAQKCFENKKITKETIETIQKKETIQTQPQTTKLTDSDLIQDNKLLQDAISKATTNSQDSANLCSQIISKTTNEQCLFELAKGSNTSNYCRDIQTENQRDSCYMYFVTNNNEFICEEITNEDFKNICSSLKDLDNYKKAQQIAKEQGTPLQYINFTIINDTETIQNETATPIVINGIKPLQNNESSITINWKTNKQSHSSVQYGINPAELTNNNEDLLLTYDHIIILNDLSKGTYYYLINSSNDNSSAISELNNFTIE